MAHHGSGESELHMSGVTWELQLLEVIYIRGTWMRVVHICAQNCSLRQQDLKLLLFVIIISFSYSPSCFSKSNMLAISQLLRPRRSYSHYAHQSSSLRGPRSFFSLVPTIITNMLVGTHSRHARYIKHPAKPEVIITLRESGAATGMPPTDIML